MEDDSQKLHGFLMQNAPLYDLIVQARDMALPDYYIGAGCVVQTVWNILTGRDPMYGISDIDFVYFDNSDLSYDAEDRMIRRIQEGLASSPVPVDIKNQARVYLWYQEKFDHPIAPYISLESAIDTWPTTATSIGVRLTPTGELFVHAPFGMDDLFSMVVRANKAQITEAMYLQKVTKWKAKWPELTVVPWDD